MNHDTGVRIIATFDDRAVPLAGRGDSPVAGSHSRNEGVNVLPAFDGPAQPLTDTKVAAPPQPEVAALVARIESALATIHAALAEIKQIQSKAG